MSTREQRIRFYVQWIRAMMLAGFALIAWLFLHALWAHRREPALLHLQAPPYGDATLQISAGMSGGHSSRILLFWQGERLRVYDFPYVDGVYALPQGVWWQVGAMCARLRLQRSHDWIGCDDAQVAHRWHLDGRPWSAAQPALIALHATPDGRGGWWVEIPAALN